jgi:hypothetical protein
MIDGPSLDRPFHKIGRDVVIYVSVGSLVPPLPVDGESNTALNDQPLPDR